MKLFYENLLDFDGPNKRHHKDHQRLFSKLQALLLQQLQRHGDAIMLRD